MRGISPRVKSLEIGDVAKSRGPVDRKGYADSSADRYIALDEKLVMAVGCFDLDSLAFSQLDEVRKVTDYRAILRSDSAFDNEQPPDSGGSRLIGIAEDIKAVVGPCGPDPLPIV